MIINSIAAKGKTTAAVIMKIIAETLSSVSGYSSFNDALEGEYSTGCAVWLLVAIRSSFFSVRFSSS